MIITWPGERLVGAVGEAHGAEAVVIVLRELAKEFKHEPEEFWLNEMAREIEAAR